MSEPNAKACLLGLACGDAMGRPLEFKSADAIAREHGRVTEMLGGGTHGQPAGTVSDDTDLARCIAESLVANDGFDGADVAGRFVEWLDTEPFDVGLMTRDAIAKVRSGVAWRDAGQQVWASRPEGSNAGNGSVMRCAPHAIYFAGDDAELERVSRASSRITHADPRCQWGCVLLNRTLANLITGESRSRALAAALESTPDCPDEIVDALEPVQAVLDGDRAATVVSESLATTGYVVDTLQAGLFMGLRADSVEAAIVDAICRGGDTDTVGAVTGAVAGARPDTSGPPSRWLDALEDRASLEALAVDLHTS